MKRIIVVLVSSGNIVVVSEKDIDIGKCIATLLIEFIKRSLRKIY